MDAKAIYINSQEQHHKFWQYELQPGLTVKYSWGRIGTTGQSTVKTYGSEYSRNDDVMIKVAEKLRKGYAKQSEEKLEQEATTARKLGTKYKIQSFEFAHPTDNGYQLIDSQGGQSTDGVYVEILDSWSKDKTLLFVGQTTGFELSGVTRKDDKIYYKNQLTPPSNFVEGVRDLLRSVAQQVQRVFINTFGDLGMRTLMIGDEPPPPEMVSVVIKAMGDTPAGISEQVIMKIAGLGVRSLVL